MLFVNLFAAVARAVVLYHAVPSVDIARQVANVTKPYATSITILPQTSPLEGGSDPVLLMIDVAPSNVERARSLAIDAFEEARLNVGRPLVDIPAAPVPIEPPLGSSPSRIVCAKHAEALALQAAQHRPLPPGEVLDLGSLDYRNQTSEEGGEWGRIPPLLLSEGQPEFRLQTHAHLPVIFAFQGTPGTGYKWMVDHSLTSAELKVGGVKLYGCHGLGKELLADQPRMFHVKIEAVQPGNYTLTLLHARPWDRTDSPTWKIVHVNVLPREEPTAPAAQ